MCFIFKLREVKIQKTKKLLHKRDIFAVTSQEDKHPLQAIYTPIKYDRKGVNMRPVRP